MKINHFACKPCNISFFSFSYSLAERTLTIMCSIWWSHAAHSKSRCLNTKVHYIRRLPWEAQSSFANQLCRVWTKFNMAGDLNSQKVRAACLLSIFFDKNSAKKLFYIFITFRLQSYWMKHLLKSCEDGWRLTAARSSRWKNHVKKTQAIEGKTALIPF